MPAKKKKIDINYKLVEIGIAEFFEFDYSIYGLQSDDVKTCELEYSVSYNVNPDTEIFGIRLSATFFKISEDENKYKLFGIVSDHLFKCFDFKDHFRTVSKDRVDIPHLFVEELLKTSFHGTRGMLYAQVNNPTYKKMLLPMADFSEIVQKLKENSEG
jgi:hypothetical protein